MPASTQRKSSKRPVKGPAKDQRGWEWFAKERVAKRQFAKVGSSENRGKLEHLFRREEGAMMISNIARDPKTQRPAPYFVDSLS